MNIDDAPWEPPELKLRAGDRVRIVYRPECPACSARMVMRAAGGLSGFDGMHGTVARINAPDYPERVGSPTWRGHTIAVDPDGYVPQRPGTYVGVVFARCELTRLAAGSAGGADAAE